MWALAIYDTRIGLVLLSRDRVGIKPLFVFEDAGQILFASELRAFRAVSSELRASALEWDLSAAQAMLGVGATCLVLPRRSIVTFEADGACHT